MNSIRAYCASPPTQRKHGANMRIMWSVYSRRGNPWIQFGLANKLPEHAARIAAVLTLIENIEAMRIDREAFERAVHLAEYYTREALRLSGAGYASPELQRAAKLLDWLKTSWGEPLISVRAIVRLGPNSIRDTATAKAAIKALVEHGWLAPHVGGAVVEGQSVREAWKTIREGGK